MQNNEEMQKENVAAEREEAAAEQHPEEAENGQETSLVGWLWRMCIPIIPCVGIIIFIVLLFVWTFGVSETETMKTWAKAALIATAIQLLVSGVIFLVLQLNVDVIGLIKAFLGHI